MRPPGPLEIGLVLVIILIVAVPAAIAVTMLSRKRSRKDWQRYYEIVGGKGKDEKLGDEKAEDNVESVSETKGYKQYIPNSIFDNLPSIVKNEIVKMPANKQGLFIDEFYRKSKNKGIAYLLWFIIGLHYIYLDKLGWQLFYWVTLGSFLIWMFIDIFRIPGMVNDYNDDIAVDILRDIKIISG